MAARTEIEAGIYDAAMVLGVELMKSVDSKTGGNYLGTAAWYEKECKGVEFPFPKLFDRLYDLYDELYGLYRELHDSFGGVRGAKADLPSLMKRLLALRERETAH